MSDVKDVSDVSDKEVKLVLVMIVKNESKIIERCLSSILPILDAIVISDTGSTDNTVELINGFIEKNSEKVKGKVYVDEWKNFGHNRSKSITNAQEWLRENQNSYNMRTTYLLTIDADMIFRIKPEFKKDTLLQKDSWCIQQKNPGMTYYNKRIFRSSLAYKCIGVTHEYWGCDDKEKDGKREDMYIDDIGDGGAKADKFERDIRLLTQGLIDEPKNERYFFYLAQSYSDSGNKEEAIKWYKKRIEAGGWQEEVFMAYLRVGDTYMYLKQIENAIHYWGLGYEHLPTRSETLFRIIHAYRLIGKNHLALLYLQTALKIPYPKDQVLFIEHPIYQFRLLEELSICGFYTPKRLQGLIATDYLNLSKNIPTPVKQQAISNLFFYIPKLGTKTHQKFQVELGTSSPQYMPSSASLFPVKTGNGGFMGNIRAVNYVIDNSINYISRPENDFIRTKNFWTHINKKGEVTKCYEVKLDKACKPIRESHVNGLEDMRLCKIGSDYIGLAVSFEYGKHNHPSICVCKYEQDDDNNYVISSVVPTDYEDYKVQKNWAPFVEGNALRAVYSHHPLTIVEIDKKTGHTTMILKRDLTDFDLSSIRGSSSPVRLPDGSWLMIIHEVLFRDTRKYIHRFMLYTSDWILKHISLPFFFNELFVEFCLSIAFNEKDQMVSVFYSTKDNTTEMMTIPIDEIPWAPNDIKKWIQEEF
jgi:glycosyltransferase involved in cell wall biosynthesis